MSAREIVAGIVSLPGGVMCDRLRRYWGAVLAACMIGFGLGWLVVAHSSSFALLIAGMMVLSAAGSIWHLPAMAALSQCFSARRGTALAVHGVGGTVGDVLGPAATGMLLVLLSWRGVLSGYAVLPLLLAAASAWAFRGVRLVQERPDPSGPRAPLRATRALLKNRTLWCLNAISALRGMCFQAYTTFLPLFLAEEMGFDSRGVGFHLGLLFSVGIVASPAMGYLSDRIGRKSVLVPTLVGLSLLSVVLARYGEGIALTILIGVLGLFLRSDYSLLSAMVLDAVGEQVAATTLGIMSFTRFALSAVSPLIAGMLYEEMGMDAVLYYVAGIYALAALALLAVRLPGSASPPRRDQAGGQPV
jgi:MFS family permease